MSWKGVLWWFLGSGFGFAAVLACWCLAAVEMREQLASWRHQWRYVFPISVQLLVRGPASRVGSVWLEIPLTFLCVLCAHDAASGIFAWLCAMFFVVSPPTPESILSLACHGARGFAYALQAALQCVGALYVSTESRVSLVHVVVSVSGFVCMECVF
jgi:hypothetical protein